MHGLSRREFLRSASLSLACAAGKPVLGWSSIPPSVGNSVLEEFGYADVSLTSELHENQLKNTHEVIMGLSEDSMLKPLRQMSGLPAPGEELGGWYVYDANSDYRKGDNGFAPAS